MFMMKYKAQVTLGVMPTRRGMLALEPAVVQKEKCMAVIRTVRPDVVRLVDIDEICTEGIIESEAFAPQVVEKFRREKMDALFNEIKKEAA